jgi:glutathione synthase/RimK-type ligase-like ATP-grasp enzyme
VRAPHCAILNAGGGAWAFQELADHLARVLRVPVSATLARHNYLLASDADVPPDARTFVPLPAIRLASDKRRLAHVFEQAGVAAPRTHLLATEEALRRHLAAAPGSEWVLKWPTGCGASGHRLLTPDRPLPPNWPRPFVVQEFIRLPRPEVYRLYCVAGEPFGWNVRRFPPGGKASPWVAHARGARYEEAGEVPAEAERQARRALAAAGLLESFGCADLIPGEGGAWLVLEVNTDGLFSVVDRDIGLADTAAEIDRRLARAFRAWAADEGAASPAPAAPEKVSGTEPPATPEREVA